ncbi:hypothetical protein FOZ63_022569, partial [Perkinsus olseni]
SGDESSGDWEKSLIVNFWRHIGTQEIVCPKAGKRDAFRSNLKWSDSELHSFQVRGENRSEFYEGVPENTGEDPLKTLNDSTFHGMMSNLRYDTKKGFDEYLSTMEESYGILREICISIQEAMASKYGTFDKMCDAYYNVFKTARDTAKEKHWKFTPYR